MDSSQFKKALENDLPRGLDNFFPNTMGDIKKRIENDRPIRSDKHKLMKSTKLMERLFFARNLGMNTVLTVMVSILHVLALPKFI